ncbi:hypothetical protein Taro_025055 [Colocasia esculenta]|uniref:Uncharacterized protein n=1 Tax=Colocasia esculenta TaxID=4460 RepID=A0A843V963_COLES|nr:hypothetical protein [Colocasia esculenta]
MPELEGFSIDSPIMENDFFFDDPNLQKLTRERASALEQLHRSMNISSSISRFSTERNIHTVPHVCQSFPSELLKCMRWDDHLQSSSTDGQVAGAANDGCLPHIQCETAYLLEKSGYHSSPFSSAQLFNNLSKGPFTPPVEKFPQKVLERKGWSSDRIVSNPELTCFRIDEHARSPEESVCREECQDTSKERFGSRERGFSSNRRPLADVTSIHQNAAAIGSTTKKDLDPIIVGSIETKFSFSAEKNDKKNLENGCGSHSISKVQNKENGFLSASRNNVHKVAASLQNRLSKVSLKADEQKRSQATFERKGSNIVSNISSFVPLVRQKQPPTAPITGKRDIKVKALEAAEAAKRQAEKKENERKMRKEAARLERMRLEQENARQLELKQRQKEEEKKKKEADIAARKRQREKEEREEKQRKKNCIEGARHRKAHEDRVRVEEKDLQLKALEDKEQKKKVLTEEAGIQHMTEKGQKIAEVVRSIEMGQDCTNIAGDARNVSDNLQSCEAPDNSKISYKTIGSSSELQQAMHDRNVTLKENRHSQSYEISPYRDSDDEEGEDDKRPKKKFVPSWASRPFQTVSSSTLFSSGWSSRKSPPLNPSRRNHPITSSGLSTSAAAPPAG